MNKTIVVNADDFGYSKSLNKAILKSFNLKIISTTTIMSNMPGFEEACELYHKYDLKDKVGIHFNLTEGFPLTEKIKKLKNFCDDDGKMYKSFKGEYLTKEEQIVVDQELKAQLKRCFEFDIKPTHCDSHHHVHHLWTIGRLVNNISTSNKIPAVRLRFNWGDISVQRKIYSGLYNLRLRLSGLLKTKYFCEIRSVNNELLNKNVPIEVMVHPCLDEKGYLTNYVNGDNLPELIDKYLPDKNFITYKMLNNEAI